MATWKKWTSTVLVNGQPEPNVEVHVYEPGTTNEITVYEDEGVTPITQPILTDSQGRYAFFVDVDTYPEIRLYLEKDGVDFSEANEDLDGVPVPGAGAGAGTFLELTDTPSSYVGRGGDVVLVKTTEDGIETQPWPVTGTILNFFLSDDAADIGSYYYMYPIESGDGYSELTSPSLSTGDDQLLWAFVTEAGEPGVEVLALGAYTTTLFLKKTGNKDVRVYWKLFKRDTGGTETEILQSAVSDYLTADNSQYLISAYLNEDQVLDPTDRLVFKLYANVSGTGTDVTVTLTMEGDYDSRLTINVLSSAFNLDRLSDVTISAPTDNELLAYDSGSGQWINQTASEAGVLAVDGSVPLTADWDIGDGRKILADQIRARDAAGLKLTDDAGNGIFIADGGYVGIGGTPEEKLHLIGGTFKLRYTGENIGKHGIDQRIERSITEAGTYYSKGLSFVVRKWVSSGVADDGYAVGLWGEAFAGDPGTHAGVLEKVYGGRIAAGIYGSGHTGVVTDVYGLRIAPYAKSGTITNLYALYLESLSTGGTVNNYYAIYQEDGNATNYFAGSVGIKIAEPGYDLDVSGDIHCTGKLTSDGGNDPPYVLYNYETRTSIIERVKKEVLPDKLNGAVLFFNGDRGQLELFLPSKGEFRTLNGEVLETMEPITQTFETEDRYYFDEETGEIKSYKVRKPARKYRLKPDHELDHKTGKIKRKIKEKKKDPKTGEEIEEIIGEEEVALEEAIEPVETTKEDGR